jgi:hypothetical protein
VNTEPSAVPRLSRRRLLQAARCIALVFVAVIAVGGCERMPQMSSAHTMHLLTALRTACSAKSPEHLEQVRQRVEEARQHGRLTDPEYDKITEIIETAAAGDWQSAEQACFRFQKTNSG